MREDMAKVLVESPRANRGVPAVKYGKRLKYVEDYDYDDEPKFIPVSRRRHPDHKYLTDFLSPLRGWLHKNIGRPWNDVYSEACQNLERRSTMGQHVFGHLLDYVERNTFMGEDGRVMRIRHYGFGEEPIEDHSGHQWYVHPTTGTLEYVSPKPRHWSRYPREPQENKQVVVDERHWYEKINNIWYYFSPVLHDPATKISVAEHYPLQHVTVWVWKPLCEVYGSIETDGRWVKSYAKKQCNKKEKQQLMKLYCK